MLDAAVDVFVAYWLVGLAAWATRVARTRPLSWRFALSSFFFGAFALLLTGLAVGGYDVGDSIKYVIVFVAVYLATNLLTGLVKFGEQIAEDPIKTVEKILGKSDEKPEDK